MTNPENVPPLPDNQQRKSMFSSSDKDGTTFREQLDYIKLTTKEITIILWKTFREYISKQRNNNRHNTN
jgi:hypothetical protein